MAFSKFDCLDIHQISKSWSFHRPSEYFKGDKSDFYAFLFRFWTLWIKNTMQVTILLCGKRDSFLWQFISSANRYPDNSMPTTYSARMWWIFFVSAVMSELVAFMFTCSIVWVISISALTRSAALGSYWEMTREQPTRVYIVSRERRRFGCFEDATQLPSFLLF